MWVPGEISVILTFSDFSLTRTATRGVCAVQLGVCRPGSSRALVPGTPRAARNKSPFASRPRHWEVKYCLHNSRRDTQSLDATSKPRWVNTRSVSYLTYHALFRRNPTRRSWFSAAVPVLPVPQHDAGLPADKRLPHFCQESAFLLHLLWTPRLWGESRAI